MTVITKYGEIRGLKKEGCNVYLSIPFAAPPVGELAFRHPVPPSPWNGMLEATRGSCNPIQAKGGFYTGNNSQDCLYLNVFAPEEAPTPMPVMVWVYGGSYSQGGAGAEEKNGTRLQYPCLHNNRTQNIGRESELLPFMADGIFYLRKNYQGLLSLIWISFALVENTGCTSH